MSADERDMSDRLSNIVRAAACQRGVDINGPFKGKGVRPAGAKAHGGDVRAARERLIAVWQEMDMLSRVTRNAKPTWAYLQRHMRKYRMISQLSLRWRLTSEGGRHVLWPEVRAMLSQLPLQVAEWYARANTHAARLNALEAMTRTELRAELRALDQANRDGGMAPVRLRKISTPRHPQFTLHNRSTERSNHEE